MLNTTQVQALIAQHEQNLLVEKYARIVAYFQRYPLRPVIRRAKAK